MGEWPPFGGDDLPKSGDDARFVILPVPYDKTASYRKGTADGPRAILKASHQIELFDEELGFDPLRDGVQTCAGITTDEMPDGLADLLEPRVRALLKSERVPICLGGEHSLSLGPIRAAASAFPGLGVLQLDAHPDLRDEYEGTRFGHGCVMRRVLDLPQVARLTGVGLRAVSDEDVEAMGDERVRPWGTNVCGRFLRTNSTGVPCIKIPSPSGSKRWLRRCRRRSTSPSTWTDSIRALCRAPGRRNRAGSHGGPRWPF